MRIDGRANDSLRPLKIERGFMPSAEGSALIEMGSTRVICTASIEDKVPPFLKDSGSGWITAEYGMLPRSTSTRTQRESSKGKQTGRTHEIQRLIGRSLRSIVDMKALGERTIWIDCDVIQADGGTRTASINGALVALADAIRHMMEHGMLKASPMTDMVAAVSVGVVNGSPMLDLCYEEDFKAEVDMNIVMTGTGEFIEVQGTAERRPYSMSALQQLLAVAGKGIGEILLSQRVHIPETVLKSK